MSYTHIIIFFQNNKLIATRTRFDCSKTSQFASAPRTNLNRRPRSRKENQPYLIYIVSAAARSRHAILDRGSRSRSRKGNRTFRGSAAEAVRSIPVASDSYDLAWTTLSNSFNRPRMVATSLVDKLLNVPSSTQESLPELTRFLCEFSESVSLLNALNIPVLGSFLLFALAFRRLPITTRKLFESTVTSVNEPVANFC
jgi:hypothetical protein